MAAKKKKLEIERPEREVMETMAFRISPGERALLREIKTRVKAESEAEAIRFAIKVLARELGLIE
jgi:hypothetical protein